MGLSQLATLSKTSPREGHSPTNRMVGALPIIFSAKTLSFRTILIALPVENPESVTTFLIEEKSAVSKCLSRKELAPRGGFEPPTFRLTASVVISSEVAGAKLNRGKLVSCSETRSVTSPVFIHSLFAFCRCSPQLILRSYYVCPFQGVRLWSRIKFARRVHNGLANRCTGQRALNYCFTLLEFPRG